MLLSHYSLSIYGSSFPLRCSNLRSIVQIALLSNNRFPIKMHKCHHPSIIFYGVTVKLYLNTLRMNTEHSIKTGQTWFQSKLPSKSQKQKGLSRVPSLVPNTSDWVIKGIFWVLIWFWRVLTGSQQGTSKWVLWDLKSIDYLLAWYHSF